MNKIKEQDFNMVKHVQRVLLLKAIKRITGTLTSVLARFVQSEIGANNIFVSIHFQ